MHLCHLLGPGHGSLLAGAPLCLCRVWRRKGWVT